VKKFLQFQVSVNITAVVITFVTVVVSNTKTSALMMVVSQSIYQISHFAGNPIIGCHGLSDFEQINQIGNTDLQCICFHANIQLQMAQQQVQISLKVFSEAYTS